MALPLYGWTIPHPSRIANITGFTSVEKYAGQTATVVGEFGYYPMAGRGLRFILSEDAPVTTGAGATAVTKHQTTNKADVYGYGPTSHDALLAAVASMDSSIRGVR